MSADEGTVNVPMHTSFDVGRFISSERRKKKMTQAELAAKLGVSRKWLSDAERGKETVELRLVLSAIRELGYTLVAAERSKPEFDFDAHLKSLLERD